MRLSWIDLTIVVAYVAATVLVGLLARRSIRGIADFLVAGRSLRTHVATASMVSTGLGLVTVMYFAEEGFKNGFAPFILGVVAAISQMIVGRTGFIISRLRHLRVMTVPEFYEIKYTRGVRLLGGCILALAGTINMGLFPILGSKFVVGFTGLPQESVNYVMIAMLVVVVLYTLMGGMVSVVLTDFAQYILLSVGFAFGTYYILTAPELGWDRIVAAVETHRGPGGFDPIANDAFGWTFLSYFLCISFFVILWQPELTRALSTQSARVARRVFWIQSGTAVGRAVIPMLWGAAALAYFNDPLHDGQSAMPEMMGALLPVGLAGILLAGMFAAFMSTHDSYLLAWSGVIVRDVLSPLKAILNRGQSERGEDDTWGGLSSIQEVRMTRIVVVLLAAFLGIFGIYYIDKMPETAFKFMFITGTLYLAGTVGTVALGLYWKRANTPGAYCALILGALAPINFLVMNLFPDWVPQILVPFTESSSLPALLSLFLGGFGMIVGSLLTQRSHPARPLDFSDME